MAEITAYSTATIHDLELLTQDPKKSVYKTVLNMVRVLDQKLGDSQKEFITSDSFWEDVAESCKKLTYMMSGLAQTYGSSELEHSVISNLQKLYQLVGS